MDDLSLLVRLWQQLPEWDIHPAAGLAWMAVTHPTPTSEHCIVEPTLEKLAKRLGYKSNDAGSAGGTVSIPLPANLLR